jgi:DNA-directed RNA polymerase subunit RPC12/RpoP
MLPPFFFKKEPAVISSETEVKCSKCKVPVEGPADAKDNDVFSCPRCGASDTLKNIIEAAGESAAQQIGDHIFAGLERTARASKNMTVSRSRTPKKQPRFYIDAKLHNL